jgi:chemotaxis protein CheX
MQINVKYVNPFIEAGVAVISQVTGIELRKGHLSYKGLPEPSYGVSIIIGVYGYLTGQVVYSMKQELADRLVERMLVGHSPEERKILYVDTLGEMANIITGNATAILNQRKELALHITAPAIATGEKLSINLINIPTIVLGLYSQFGPIEVNVALKETEALSEVQDRPAALSEV